MGFKVGFTRLKQAVLFVCFLYVSICVMFFSFPFVVYVFYVYVFVCLKKGDAAFQSPNGNQEKV